MRCVNCGYDNSNERTLCLKCGHALMTSYESNSRQNKFNDNEFYEKSNSENNYVPKQTVLNVNKEMGDEAARKTVIMNPANNEKNISDFPIFEKPYDCPSCGYPIIKSSENCPSCGVSLKNIFSEKKNSNVTKPAYIPVNNQVVVCQECKQEISITCTFCPHCGQRVHPATTLPSKNKVLLPHCCLTMVSEANEILPESKRMYEGDSIELNRLNTEVDNRSITTHTQAVLTCEKGEWYIENHSTYETTYLVLNRKIKLEEGDVIMLGDRKFKFEKE